MQDIKKREEKMKQKRKNTPFRDFLKEIASWQQLTFYRRNGMVSRFPKSNRTGKVINYTKFNENVDKLTYKGISYNLDKTFFENYKKLFINTEIGNVLTMHNCENSSFADVVVGAKNAYLSFNVTLGSENVAYSFAIRQNSKNILNSVMVRENSEIVYLSTGIINSFKIFYSRYIYNCSDIRFSSNLQNCKECILCDGLENKSFYIKNKEYTKEDYMLEKERILKGKQVYFDLYTGLNSISTNIASNNAQGNHVIFSKDISNANYCYRINKGHNAILVGGNDGDENIYDMFMGGFPSATNFYGVNGAGGGENLFNSTMISFGSNIYYSYGLVQCSYCLGCVGLQNKSFCILNKQYTKEERFELANKIFAQMDTEGILGDFFPGKLNPFYFNDTVAYLMDDSFTKEEVKAEGYLRRDDEIKVDIPEGSETVKSTKLDQYQGFDSEGKRKIDLSILKKVIIDKKGNYYRIVKMEYDFLMKYGLPLPEIHWLDRIKLGFKFK